MELQVDHVSINDMKEYANLVSVDITTKAFGWRSLYDLSRLHSAIDEKSNGIAPTTAGWPCNSDLTQLL